MKLSLLALVLALGSPLPYLEAVDDDAVVEVTKVARRDSSLERRKKLVPPAPLLPPPSPAPIPVLLRPAPHVDLALVSTRPPPAR